MRNATRHLLKPCSVGMKQVLVDEALEAVLAAAQRPSSNEDSRADRLSSLGGLRRSFVTLLGFAALVAGSLSCGDAVRDSRSPVFLALDSLTDASLVSLLQSDVQKLVTAPAPCTIANPCPTIFADLGLATFRIVPKDIVGLASPTTNNEVTITRYHVSYRRTDGRNVQGVDIPYAFDGVLTAAVPGPSMRFELVRIVAKGESPLVQLVNSRSVITTIADVTFYGTDRVGNAVSATGSIQIDFGNFGDS
jgi:hypothetical protein